MKVTLIEEGGAAAVQQNGRLRLFVRDPRGTGLLVPESKARLIILDSGDPRAQKLIAELESSRVRQPER